MTARSWVIHTSAVPDSRHSICASWRICAWIVTSRAVVGSSAMMRSGPLSSAIAIATRWRMPPENWWGYAASRSSGEEIPTFTSVARARSRADAALTSWCARIASTIWVSMRSTGFRVIIGSWKIIAMLAPRSLRISCSGFPTSSIPLNRIEPETTRPGGSTSPRMEKPVTDLPDPDSPARPRISPGRTVNEMPSTALTIPSLVKKWVSRSETARVGALPAPPTLPALPVFPAPGVFRVCPVLPAFPGLPVLPAPSARRWLRGSRIAPCPVSPAPPFSGRDGGSARRAAGRRPG